MQIFKLKEGTKSYDWVKDVMTKELEEKNAYGKRVQEAMGIPLGNCIYRSSNFCYARKAIIHKFEFTPEEYAKMDKDVWKKLGGGETAVYAIPSPLNEKGKRIREAMQSFNPVTCHAEILKQLGLKSMVRETDTTPVSLFTYEDKYYFVLTDDNIYLADDNNDDLELITEEDAKRLTGFKDKRVDYSK
jgi:hypothetical protein